MVGGSKIKVSSPNVRYSETYIESEYKYETSVVESQGDELKVTPRVTRMQFRTENCVPKIGVMLVGWGGNNGSTLTATILSNKMKLSWKTKEGSQLPNYFGSLTQSATLGIGADAQGKEIFIPFKNLLPMVNPDDLVLGGWDISSLNLAEAMERAKVLDYDLQCRLKPYMEKMIPLPAIYDRDFIAANQESRADNVLTDTKFENMKQVRRDIQNFKLKNNLDKVVVLWTANTERFSDVVIGINDTADNLLKAIEENSTYISPSTLYAVASILESCAYINGSPQNTFVPGCIELAEKYHVHIGGDDFKSGQTKFKSVLVDYLVGAGIKPVSIVSYNHLGNNDGKNLSAPQQFRSKEISKSNVVDDMVASNPVLFKTDEKPDHCVVIKYVPYVGDSKRALDEYTSEIMMGGRNTIVIHNTCEDSLLAAPIILDLIILTELCQRISFRILNKGPSVFQSMNSVLSVLGYFCKAPLVPRGAPVVNALFKQRACIENLFRACLGLPSQNYIGMEHKLSDPTAWHTEEQSKVLPESPSFNGLVVKQNTSKQNNNKVREMMDEVFVVAKDCNGYKL